MTELAKSIDINSSAAETCKVESNKQVAKKNRQSKKDLEKQTMLSKGKITKTIGRSKCTLNSPETASRHFSKPVPCKSGETTARTGGHRRRTDWTPTKDSVGCKVSDFMSLEKTPPAVGFKNLLESYERKGDNLQQKSESEPPDSDVFKKRKMIELVKTNVRTNTGKILQQPKMMKKKPRTLTELATATYVSGADSDSNFNSTRPTRARKAKTPAVQNFLAYDGKDKVITRRGTGKLLKTANSKSSSKSSRPGEITLPVLLSPSTALKETHQQDFIFGTSSQLAREQSPTMLRDIQTAFRVSLQEEEFPDIELTLKEIDGLPKKRPLWMAGARDENGGLLEIVDLVDTSEPPTRMPTPKLPERCEIGIQGTSSTTYVGTDLDCSLQSDMPALVDQNSHVLPTDSSRLDAIKRSSRANSQETHKIQQNDAPTLLPPEYSLYTDAQLANEVHFYGLKSIKKRSTMISTLQECWLSKHSISMPSTDNRVTRLFTTSRSLEASKQSERVDKTQQQTAKSSKRCLQENPEKSTGPDMKELSLDKGRVNLTGGPLEPVRPRSPKRLTKSLTKPKIPKQAAIQNARCKDTVIADSDSDGDFSDFTDIVKDRVDVHAYKSVQPATLSTQPPPEVSSMGLSESIHKAVITAPMAIDPKNPSWHEKMLLYDPIVLEQFTYWLNEGQLSRVGYDEEVSVLQVKKWCESQSICCVWKDNSKGQERKKLNG